MGKVNKIFNCDIKQVGEESERVLRFVTSTEAVDRDGDIIEVSGWQLDNYMKNPVILFGHNYEGLPVGKSINVQVDNAKLIQDVKFPTKDEYEFADTVYRLAKAGYLNATSVGFIGLESEPMYNEKGNYTGKRYKKQELLETSIVPVPSNPTALMEARSKGIITDNEFKIFEESKTIITKPGWDETETSYRFRIREPELFQEGSFRTVLIKKDKPRVNSVMGRLKDKESLTIQSVIFPKEDGWDLSNAKEWLENHEDLTKGVDKMSFEIDNSKDTDIFCNEKTGATLSGKTKKMLDEIHTSIHSCNDRLRKFIDGISDEPDPEPEKSNEIAEIKQALEEIKTQVLLLSQKNKTDSIKGFDLDDIELPKNEKDAAQNELNIEPGELKQLIIDTIKNELNGGN